MRARRDDAQVWNREGPTLTVLTAPAPLTIRVCTPRIVRVRIGEGNLHTESAYVPAREWPGAQFTEETDPVASVDTGELVLRVTTDPWCVTFVDQRGDARVRVPLAELRCSPSVVVRLELADVQHFYGLGEGGHQFDRLGVTRRFWNNHDNHGHGADVPIPLLLSHLGYGLFFDNTRPADVTVGGADGGRWVEYRSASGPLDLYYLGGTGGLREVLGDVATLLGQSPLPPRWALGYLQSTRHFVGSAEWYQLLATIREKRVACDALIFLSTYGEALGWNRGVGHLDCEPRVLPDPPTMFTELRAQHFHAITHEYPVLHPDSPLFAEACGRGYVLDAGYARVTSAERPMDNYREGQRYLDFSRSEVRAWWWRQHRPLVNLGIDGWWLDGGEGPPPVAWGQDGPGVNLHNRYDLMRQQAFAEGEASDRPDQRAFLLCRSGGPGMQRHGAACWSGDIDATFPSLEAQPAIGLNLGLSGVPYWGTDIGGFYRVAPHSDELFVRWFQFGSFCPIFRAHGRVWREHLPWVHGSEVEAICRQYLELRYRLLPYTYTLAWQAHRHGLPLMRPLVLNYPDDPRAWNQSSEYLWGDDLLVAPVTREGATHWPVYLPAGTWYDFWTHERYDGSRGLTVPAPLDRLPLFVREGAMLPIGPATQYHDEQPLTAVTLLVYGGTRSSFTLYEDDGMTRAYGLGRYALTDFECVSSEDALTLRIAAARGETTIVPPGRVYTVKAYSPRRPRRVRLEGAGALPERRGEGDSGWWRDGEWFTCARVPAQPAVLEIEW
jgi:alpha-glucosidase (family GH31 glycosyl hydrolase)